MTRGLEPLCEECGLNLPWKLVDRIVGACPFCRASFDFGRQSADMMLAKTERPRILISAPPSVVSRTEGPMLALVYREEVAPNLVYLGFVLVFLVCTSLLAFSVRGLGAIACFIFIAVFSKSGYRTLARLVHATRIHVSVDAIRIERRKATLRVDKRLLAQLYVMDTKSLAADDESRSTRPLQRTYALCAMLHDGQRVVLLADIPDLRAARFMEQAIEQHLGLPDRAVYGERPPQFG